MDYGFNAPMSASDYRQPTIGPGRGLQLKTIDEGDVNQEAQIQGAPTFSKLRRALLQTSTIAANEDNPAKKREMLRAAMEGTGTGFSDVSLASHNAALNKVSADTAIENRGRELTYQADQASSNQAAAIAAQKEMQGLSLTEARAAQERGITAQQALQEKQLAFTGEQARLNREYEAAVRLQDARSQIGMSAFNAEMAKANADAQKASPYGWVDKPGTGKWWEPTITQEDKNRQWQRSYDAAMKKFYAGGY
jgi:hypothetical protein